MEDEEGRERGRQRNDKKSDQIDFGAKRGDVYKLFHA